MRKKTSFVRKTKKLSVKVTEEMDRRLRDEAITAEINLSKYLRYHFEQAKVVISNDMKPIASEMYRLRVILSEKPNLQAFNEGVNKVCQSCISLSAKYKTPKN